MFPQLSRRELLYFSVIFGVAPLTSCASSSAEIKQWYHAYSEAGVQQLVVDTARKYTAAKVEVDWIVGDYDNKSFVAILSPSSPDVLEFGGGIGVDNILAGELVPVEDLYGNTLHDFHPEIMKEVIYKGKIYGIPQTIDSQFLFYRPSILRAHGLSAPRTLPELVHVVQTISTTKTKGLFLGNEVGSFLAASVIRSAGAKIIAGSTTDIVQESVAQTLSQLHQLLRNNTILVDAPTDWSDPSALNTGLCAMQLCGSWAIPQIETALGDDIAAIPWPAYSPTYGQPVIPIGAYTSVVSAKSHHIQESKAYMKWLWIENTDFQLKFSQEFGLHIPVRTSLYPQAKNWQKTALRRNVLDLVKHYGTLVSDVRFTPLIRQTLADTYTRCVRDGKDPLTELKLAAKTIIAELSRTQK